MKKIETIGTLAGIVGALLVASKLGQYGYPFFLVSSVSLFGSAIAQRQTNFIVLQGVYLVCNLIGFFNYVVA